MTTIERQAALTDQLQAVENDLLAAGKYNVTVNCAAGVFTWVRRGAGREPIEPVSFIDEIQKVEDMIISGGRDHLVIMTQAGTFTWSPHSS